MRTCGIELSHGMIHPTKEPGCPLRQPVSCEAALNQLDRLGGNWLRHYHKIWAGGEGPMRDHQVELTAGDPERYASCCHKVRDTIGAMKKALTGLERSLEKLERKQKG